MLIAIQEPDIRMTQLEDFVRLLMKLGHPIADLYTIYLNYHRSRLESIIEKYQQLKPLSEDEKESSVSNINATGVLSIPRAIQCISSVRREDRHSCISF